MKGPSITVPISCPWRKAAVYRPPSYKSDQVLFIRLLDFALYSPDGREADGQAAVPTLAPSPLAEHAA